MPTALKTKYTSGQYLIIGVILLIAFALRIYSFAVNTRAYGDVNTISISSQQFATNGVIQYTWLIERYESTVDDPLTTPAYQHGPALPFTAGILAKLFGNTDTFFALKLITFVMGMALIVVIYRYALNQFSPFSANIAALFITTSPALIDFSGNGSPYIISALAMSVLVYQCAHFRFKLRDTALIALTCSLAFQYHPSMLGLTICAAAIGVWKFKALGLRHYLVFIGVWGIIFLPSSLWYLHYYGRFYLSGQFYFITGEMNLATPQRAEVISNPLKLLTSPLAEQYFGLILSRASVYLKNILFEVGAPLLIFALLSGIVGLWRSKQSIVYVIIPRLIYLALTAAAISLFHMRFLIPVLPGVMLLATYGLHSIREIRPYWRNAIGIVAVIYAGWALFSYFTADTPPNRYYRNEIAQNIAYDASRDIAQQLRNFPPATIVGCDDARRILYDNPQFRLKVTGCGIDAERLSMLRADSTLNIRYVMYEVEVIQVLSAAYPDAKIILQNDMFAVLDLTPDTE